MKTFLMALAAASLTGCAVYPAGPAYGNYGNYGTYGGYGPAPGYVAPPIYLYGSGVYQYGGYSSPYRYPHSYYSPRGFNHFQPGGFARRGFGGRGPGGGANRFGGAHMGHSGHR